MNVPRVRANDSPTPQLTRRATLNISQEAKSQLDAVKSSGQSYDGIIRQLVKFWQQKRGEAKK